MGLEWSTHFLLYNLLNYLINIHSNPTPADSNLTPWGPVNGYPVNYARLGHKIPEEFTVLQMERDIYGDRTDFWRQLKAHIPAEQREKKIRDEL